MLLNSSLILYLLKNFLVSGNANYHMNKETHLTIMGFTQPDPACGVILDAQSINVGYAIGNVFIQINFFNSIIKKMVHCIS